jgi:peptidoglycan/xylan/chitin deacetylase (PgdA/CDA1 family)
MNWPQARARRRRNADQQWTLFAGGVALASVLLLLVALTRPAPRPVLVLGAAATAEVVARPVPGSGAVQLPTLVPTLAPTTVAQPIQPALQAGIAVGSAPILMYHYVRAVDQGADPLGWELSITPELLDQQLALLAQQGYTGVRMDVLARCMRGEPLCPPRPVALTFDDGYADAYTAALPVLQRYGFTATFYIVSGFVGQPGYMTWEQLAVLRDAGMEIGAHSISHPDLTTLDAFGLARQLNEPKAEIEARLGVRVVSFCYPAGRYNGAVIEAVRAAGYENATTTRWDNDYSDLLALPRRRVSGGTTGDEVGWMVVN